MSKPLVIVESPAKARTIAGFLGDGYVVESSIGHIRDLPRRAGDIPPKYKKEPWARLGVDLENDFRPLYIVDPDKKSHLKKLKDLLSEADELVLATDEDREGESIAWHLTEVLKPRVPVKRMVFHEITRRAIEEAIEHPREIDRNLVDAQEARRILDRLYGYEVSPVLWKKIMPRLSAGRVQSVATRVIVERERERMRFRSALYWDLDGVFAAKAGELAGTLIEVDGKRVASGKDFGSVGKLQNENVAWLDEGAARALEGALPDASCVVTSVQRKPYTSSPAAPFMTSTLQQEAGRKLRFAASRAMRAAQRLYENGYITYMRTDSTTLSEAALDAARKCITGLYGADYLPDKPRTYKKKVKNAQEAHEAIRPAGDRFRTPDEVAKEVGPDEAKLYELVWKRTVASQMKDARGERMQVRLEAKLPIQAANDAATFSITGRTITFPGFLRAYVEGSDDPEAELEDRERPIPNVREGETVAVKSVEAKSHETQPPARFTEASLVRRLEELGVGRPSTYASIIGIIQDRGYVWKKGQALIPTFKAFAVVALLEQHFDHLVDYAFTARMEDDLDAIARGQREPIPWLRRFYFGGSAANDPAPASAGTVDAAEIGLKAMVSDQLGEIDARQINTVPIGKDSEGRSIAVRVGRYGPYLEREDQTARLPDELPPDEVTLERAIELLEAPSGDRSLGDDPESGLTVYVRAGRFGPYVQAGEADGKEKPKTASLFKDMTPDTLTLEQALKLLSLPREVGEDPADGVAITAQNGRYGPYISKGTDSRSLETEAQLFTVTVTEALELLKQPKKQRRAAPSAPLKELGNDPVSGQPITLRKGRFGPYVTDGETNASLRTGDDPESITPERAAELLQVRRDRGPAKPRAGRRKAASKRKAGPAKKKAPAKKKGAAKKKTATKNAAAAKAKAAS